MCHTLTFLSSCESVVLKTSWGIHDRLLCLNVYVRSGAFVRSVDGWLRFRSMRVITTLDMKKIGTSTVLCVIRGCGMFIENILVPSR